MKTLYCLIIGLAALLSVPLSANELFEARLENGMRLLVREDHRAPLVVSQLWYKVGSMDEPAGITGISHMLEHMMFKGTKQFGPGEFSRLIDEVGGEQNAFTGQDFTVYYEKMPKDKLALRMHRNHFSLNVLWLPLIFLILTSSLLSAG